MNESLPIFLDNAVSYIFPILPASISMCVPLKIGGGIAAVMISTVMIVIFGYDSYPFHPLWGANALNLIIESQCLKHHSASTSFLMLSRIPRIIPQAVATRYASL